MKSILLGVFVAFALLAAGATAQSAPNTLGKIKAAKAINVAFSGDSLPFSYVADGNKPAGYSIDLCQRVIAAISRAVGEPDLKVNWRVGSVSERLQMVASGKADLDCANTTMTQTRLKDVDFSNLIFVDGGGFLVTVEMQKSQRELLWEIGIRYDDGGYGTITQTQAPALRIGDRARVTDTGLELVPRR